VPLSANLLLFVIASPTDGFRLIRHAVMLPVTSKESAIILLTMPVSARRALINHNQ
jgi:hypothetical protein